MHAVPRGQKRASDALELEFQPVVKAKGESKPGSYQGHQACSATPSLWPTCFVIKQNSELWYNHMLALLHSNETQQITEGPKLVVIGSENSDVGK